MYKIAQTQISNDLSFYASKYMQSAPPPPTPPESGLTPPPSPEAGLDHAMIILVVNIHVYIT